MSTPEEAHAVPALDSAEAQVSADEPVSAGAFDAGVPPAGLDVPHTGDPVVDEALTRLAQIAAASPEEQVNTFDAVHRILQDRLADVEG